MFQAVTAADERPTSFPILLARLPVKTTPTAVTASSTTVTNVTPSRMGSFVQIGRPSSTSNTALDARMNADTYPEADQIAPAMPTMNSPPAAPWFCASPLMALVMIDFAGPGANVPTFLVNESVAVGPSSPTIDTIASSAGKMASTP